MSFLKKVLPFGLIGMAVKALTGGKKKKPEVQQPVPGPNRNLAAERAQQSALLAKRRGVLANIVTGAGGAEAPGGGSKLGN